MSRSDESQRAVRNILKINLDELSMQRCAPLHRERRIHCFERALTRPFSPISFKILLSIPYPEYLEIPLAISTRTRSTLPSM